VNICSFKNFCGGLYYRIFRWTLWKSQKLTLLIFMKKIFT